MKHSFLLHATQLFFFLLPWQTRWIYDRVLIGGGANDFGIMSLYATEVLLIGIFVMASPLRITRSLRPVALAGGGVAVAAAISLFAAQDVWLAAASLVHLTCALLLFFLLLDDRISLRQVFIAFVAGLILPSLLGVYQALTGGSGASTLLGIAGREAGQLGDAVVTLADGTRLERAYGSFSHPNIFGGYLAMAILGLLWLWKEEKDVRIRHVMLTGMAWFSCLLITTWSRSAFLGVFLGLCLGVWSIAHMQVKRLRSLALPLAVIAIAASCAVLFAFPMAQERFSIDDTFTAPSVTERLGQYRDYPVVMQGAWVIGHGIGNYPLALSTTFADRLWWQYQPIHNTPLLMLGEIGIVGIIFVGIFVVVVDRRNRSQASHPEGMVAFSFAVTLVPVALLDHYLWSFWSGLAICALVAACLARLGEVKTS